MWLSFIAAILPSLIQMVERLLGPKTGEIKKEIVMTATQIAMQAVDTFATGGAAATWTAIKPQVSIMVDAGVAIAFPKPNAQSLVDAQR